MYLQRLRIRNFRNLRDLELHPQPGVNLLWGANAQGKTNILEAIYFLATGRSFRTTREEECLPFDSPPDCAAGFEAALVRGGIRHDIQIGFSRQSKSVRVDDKALSRLTDLWGVLATVLFTPDDLHTVGGGPSGRRQWMDVALSQVDQFYLDALKRFARALRHRNALLRPGPHPSRSRQAQVEAYEAPLAEAAGHILLARRDFLRRIEPLAAQRHQELSGHREALALRYDHFLHSTLAKHELDAESLRSDEVSALYAQQLAARREEDIARGQTLRGPHRDDVALVLDQREARSFASQGQTRTLALSLRLAEVDFIQQAAGHPPLLLLDDILSELDPERLRYLLSSLASADIQAILTTTDLDPVRALLRGATTWKVENGQVVGSQGVRA